MCGKCDVDGNGVVLDAIGLAGNVVIAEGSDALETRLKRLQGLDWSRWLRAKDGKFILSSEGTRQVNPIWNGII